MLLTPASLIELKDRILNRCEWHDGPLETPCLIFTGALDGDGYGIIWGDGRNLGTHRAIWMAENGEVEERKEICHDCDNPPCCELKHLRADTHLGNMGDAVRRGRLADQRGENNSRAALTEIQVGSIKYFLLQGWTSIPLAERYRVSRTAVQDIKLGRRWSHVQPFQPLPGEPLPAPPPLPNRSTYRRYA
jgi:HNH endonuclease